VNKSEHFRSKIVLVQPTRTRCDAFSGSATPGKTGCGAAGTSVNAFMLQSKHDSGGIQDYQLLDYMDVMEMEAHECLPGTPKCQPNAGRLDGWGAPGLAPGASRLVTERN
jgi:hypothetical protein